MPHPTAPIGRLADAIKVSRGFVRDKKGNITTFNQPGSIHTRPLSINASGEITGWYRYANHFLPSHVSYGFVRGKSGTSVVARSP